MNICYEKMTPTNPEQATKTYREKAKNKNL